MSIECDICSINFENKNAFNIHLRGKRHTRKHDRSIIISPLPQHITVEKLVKSLLQYGKIEQYVFKGSYLMVRFYDRLAALTALYKWISIGDVRLNVRQPAMLVKRKEKKKKKNKNKNKILEAESSIDYQNIKHIFQPDYTFDEQLTSFLNAVQLTEHEISARYNGTCTKLEMIFKMVFPKCKIYMFGSTQSGLCLKECDLDMYMDIGEPIQNTESPVQTDSWTLRKIFAKIKHILYGRRHEFSNVVLIPKARTPIIKFCFIPTNISCDLSFSGIGGLYKGLIIKRVLSLDSRIKPLMVLIKYWGRHFKIFGTGRITNYALILLIIFYLQQPSVNIIPPLKVFKNTCHPVFVDGWQVNFDENVSLPPITNQNTIPQLLQGFFLFYTTFDFKSCVISTLDGVVHTRAKFTLTSLLAPVQTFGESIQGNKISKLTFNTEMCILDPIDATYNVAYNVLNTSLDTFQKYCAIGSEIFVPNSWENTCRYLMITLFSALPYSLVSGNSNEPRKHRKAFKNSFLIIINAIDFQHTENSNEMEVNTSDIEEEDIIKSNWHSTVFNLIKDIFNNVLVVKIRRSTDNKKTEPKNIDVLEKYYQRIILNCQGFHCVWQNRDHAKNDVQLNSNLNCLQREALISQKIIEMYNKGTKLYTVNVRFECVLHMIHPSKIILMIYNNGGSWNSFNSLKCFIIDMMKQIMQPLAHIDVKF